MTNPLDGVNSWLYHLGNVDAAEAARIGANNAGLVVIDYAHDTNLGTVAETPAELEVMRAGKDKLIVSYLSIGEAEDYRPYWQSSWNTNPPDFLSASNPEWPDNFKVKYWDPQWQAIIFDYVDKIIASGFNGVYMDIIDAYQYWEGINPVPGMNYAQEMADFVAAIRAHAEQKLSALGDTRDFVIMGQNGEELLDNPTYLNALDGIGKEDLRFYYPNGSEGSFKPVPDGWWTGSQPYLEQAEAAGVQVFVVEYMTQARQTQYSSMLASEIQYLRDHGIPLYVSEDRDLTSIYTQPGGGDPNIYGSAQGEILNGTEFADVMYALGGNDDVSGLGGNDVLIGGSGADILRGGAGQDTASYQTAAAGVTVSLIAPAASAGDAAGDTFISVEDLSGSAFADRLEGNGDANTIDGNGGEDTIVGNGGSDVMRGGLGNDTYYVDNAGDVTDEVNGGGGIGDYVYSSVSYTAAAGIERLYLSGAGAINGTGRDGQNDILIGNSGNNILNGLSGSDVMRGGLGNDTYYVDNAGDVTDEVNGGGGIGDYVYSSVSYTAAAGIERLYLSGAGAINGTGRDGQNDILVGNSGNNILNGLSGNDVLIGGLGLDTFRFDTALNAAANKDMIIDFVAADDTIELENGIFTTLTTTGALAASLFKDIFTGTIDTTDRILYNSSTGALSYDSDGSGANAAIQIATLTTHPVLTNADFVVI
jgi:cysteinyl-tRNA synthetase